MKYFVFVLFFLVLLIENSFSQYTNFKIHPSQNIQIEPLIVSSPLDPQMLFASSFTRVLSNSMTSEGVYVSTNGGASWFGSDTCTGAPIQNHTGDPGPIIDKNGAFILVHQGATPLGMFSHTSTNNGSTWSNAVLVASNNQEKGSPGTDDNSSSPFYGRTYMAWTHGTSPYEIILSYTTNSGGSWTSFISLNNTPANHQSLGAVISCAPNGTVYVTWASAVIPNSPEDCIGFAKSTNGGVNWVSQECIFSVGGIRTHTFAPWNLIMNGYPTMGVDRTGGPKNGWIYIISSEVNHSPAGSDADLVFHRSTDAGQSWSPGIRVNQDAMNNGKLQFMPALTVDDGGGLNVFYYDTRNNSDSTVEVYLSRSTDGGDHWTDYKISDHKFKPKTATSFGPGLWGDHIGATNANGKLFPVWMDDFNSPPGTYQIWSTIVDINTIGIEKISTEIPASFSIGQNFPNPFNPSTKIRFNVPNSSSSSKHVSLVIYDINGRLLSTLVNQGLNAGTYEVTWNATDFPSGVYYYRLSTDNYFETKKMVLLK